MLEAGRGRTRKEATAATYLEGGGKISQKHISSSRQRKHCAFWCMLKRLAEAQKYAVCTAKKTCRLRKPFLLPGKRVPPQQCEIKKTPSEAVFSASSVFFISGSSKRTIGASNPIRFRKKIGLAQVCVWLSGNNGKRDRGTLLWEANARMRR